MDKSKELDLPQSEIARELRDYFPQLSPGDIAKFEAHLHERNLSEERNGYRLNFVGREYARLQAGLPSDMLISPDTEHNALPENAQSGNVFITGDNLEALRHLQNAYSCKVKMIYIDPPYNTGKEFVYNDNFELSDEKLKTTLGYGDEDVARLRSIQGKSSHSAWLTFMYPRLALAKKLLADDGVIFVSIDDNEQANLKLLMDDVFGEGNFVGEFIWRKKNGGGQDKEYFVIEHEYILAYRKSVIFAWYDSIEERDISEFNKADQRGKYKVTKLAKWGNTARREDRPSMYFGLTAPDGSEVYPVAPDGNAGRWRVGKERVDHLISNNLIHWDNKNHSWIVYEKEYFDNQSKIVKDRSILYSLANTGDGTNILTELFTTKDVFENPKPIEVLSLLISRTTNKNDIILDFFAGSGTTAHAVMQLNAEDGGNRRWMLVQLDEPTAENSEARNLDYETIDQISRKRIKLAAKKTGDTSGFKHYRLVAPQVQTLDKIETFDPNLGGFEDMITPMGGLETLLATWLIDDGYPFDTQVEEVLFEDYTAHYVGTSQTLYLIDRGLTTAALKEILNRIGRGELIVSTIVSYPYSFEFEMMRELEIGVKMVDGLKLLKRF